MCITEIWTYRECGCHYHHPFPCHPSFTPSLTIPQRQKAGHPLSSGSSSTERSPTSTDGSTGSRNDPFPAPSRQCSVRHIVHKSFLEPICDDCLLEELGLRPELGPILGGRDRDAGLHGEEWLLESRVEIRIEEPDERTDLASSSEHDEEDGADADDEGEVRGRRARRCGMDISRGALRISSDLSADEREGLALFRKELRGVESEGRKWARAAIKAQKERRCLTPYWPRHLRHSPSRTTEDAKRAIGVSPRDSSSVGSVRDDAWTLPPSTQPSKAEESGPEDAQLLSNTLPNDARNASFDPVHETRSLCEANPEQDSHQDAQHPSWSEHLTADLQDRPGTRHTGASAGRDGDARRQQPCSSSSTPSSPHTATPFTSASWPSPDQQPLNIASSEFDTDDSATHPDPHLPSVHAHTTSTHSTMSHSTFCSTDSGPASPRQPTTLASSPSTRPTTAASTTTLSLHPLSTTLTVSTPHRPSLAPRTSSLRSPPASSLLLHSTPPLHQSPTSVFVCVHERWAFSGCRCEGPSWVRSCVCDGGSDVESGNPGEDRAKDGCRAVEPIVRTRWFFNSTCQACLGGT